MPVTLPKEFLDRMRLQIPDPQEFEAFIQSYDEAPVRGLRLNLKKLLENELHPSENNITYDRLVAEWNLIPLKDASFAVYNGKKYFREFYMDEEMLNKKGIRPGRHPYHEAGLYYIQGTEAMQAVTHLDIRPFDRVADLCASPGGKSTQAADMLSLDAGGFLISNEYVALRAKTLSSNIERMGIRNAAVLNEDTGKLAQFFPEYFTRIIVDAPCSGEGMFRKDETAVTEWSPENVSLCAARQKEIVSNACRMLAPGGKLCYSTCTFEKEEDEDIRDFILENHSDMKLIFEKRVWPHKEKGEGHYISVFIKDGLDPFEKELEKYGAVISAPEGSINTQDLKETKVKDQIYLVPKVLPDLRGLKFFRTGILKATDLTRRIEPEHSLTHAMSIHDDKELKHFDFTVCDYSSGDPRTEQYLKGLQIPAPQDISGKGWCVVSCDGVALGLGKLVNSQIKNHYPKGLRFN
ncbi:RsmF rRNA methyltransferase first C-terminal domain-containing protein [Oribacterium sp. WCC10]|uniref:RsmF rRNA methyltransferase first C-terminal domain-containing protein n=1 Tax=Oribacterium sp. WCC10 TaxID=1855343 RepID=UPI0008E71C25|nr:RsmF rRNA methyltransferase first C-terminal domain-containing protein [Oribacterium sp. WCC10]SFG57423.1 16S rRNA C967 or C1407 C5-methylase, RsmB/RsmF family [Oribacterium sp. WCC10]